MRFAVLKNTQVRGGFSRLLKHFRCLHQGSIVSYADRTYSSGEVYELNDFKLVKINKPAYWYVKENSEKMLHRSSFRKSQILKKYPELDSNMTENNMMITLGYSKIFDCGTKTYILE
jgi:hypothetical protein